jgi:regulator of replication initiation timing
LTHVKDELDKLELELNYQHDEIKNLDYECEELLVATKALAEENKKLKEQEADNKLELLQNDMVHLDQLYRDV